MNNNYQVARAILCEAFNHLDNLNVNNQTANNIYDLLTEAKDVSNPEYIKALNVFDKLRASISYLNLPSELSSKLYKAIEEVLPLNSLGKLTVNVDVLKEPDEVTNSDILREEENKQVDTVQFNIGDKVRIHTGSSC